MLLLLGVVLAAVALLVRLPALGLFDALQVLQSRATS